MGDMSGYSLTFVGTEKILANLLDAATEADLYGSAGDVFGSTTTLVTA
jgi:hypothetical protein